MSRIPPSSPPWMDSQIGSHSDDDEDGTTEEEEELGIDAAVKTGSSIHLGGPGIA